MTTATQTTTTATRYAVIDTDGKRPVVWGVGSSPAAARIDAEAQDGYAETEHNRTVEISADRAARIEAGDVDASDL